MRFFPCQKKCEWKKREKKNGQRKLIEHLFVRAQESQGAAIPASVCTMGPRYSLDANLSWRALFTFHLRSPRSTSGPLVLLTCTALRRDSSGAVMQKKKKKNLPRIDCVKKQNCPSFWKNGSAVSLNDTELPMRIVFVSPPLAATLLAPDDTWDTLQDAAQAFYWYRYLVLQC